MIYENNMDLRRQAQNRREEWTSVVDEAKVLGLP
jgi:hypothetical protein